MDEDGDDDERGDQEDGDGAANGEAIVGDTMTLVITCKSGKTLGLFKKRRICGGELFSELVSHELVEQIGEKYLCTEGNTFGVHDGHAIWVKGCKGRFKVTGIRKGQQAESKELPIPSPKNQLNWAKHSPCWVKKPI